MCKKTSVRKPSHKIKWMAPKDKKKRCSDPDPWVLLGMDWSHLTFDSLFRCDDSECVVETEGEQ